MGLPELIRHPRALPERVPILYSLWVMFIGDDAPLLTGLRRHWFYQCIDHPLQE